jgi:hypothetical protein
MAGMLGAALTGWLRLKTKNPASKLTRKIDATMRDVDFFRMINPPIFK